MFSFRAVHVFGLYCGYRFCDGRVEFGDGFFCVLRVRVVVQMFFNELIVSYNVFIFAD
jgi:hypothetical protein